MRVIVSCLATLLCLGTAGAFAAPRTTEEQKTRQLVGQPPLSNFTLNERP